MYEKTAEFALRRTGFGTSLPASPSEGDEFVLVDSVSAPTYHRRLRYVAAKASNKWIFLGGPPKVASTTASNNQTANSTWENITNNPSFTVPVAGDYRVRVRFDLLTAASIYTWSGGVGRGAVSPSVGHQAAQGVASSLNAFLMYEEDPITDPTVLAAIPVSTVLTTWVWQNGAVTTSWNRRYLFVEPVALGG